MSRFRWLDWWTRLAGEKEYECWKEAYPIGPEAVRREVTLLRSETIGAQAFLGQAGLNSDAVFRTKRTKQLLRELIEGSTTPSLLIDPRPGLRIVEANDAFAAATLTSRDCISGDKLFAVFPDNPNIAEADGVSNWYGSLQKCAQEGRANCLPAQRYDVQHTTSGFVERYWRSLNAPIFDDDGSLMFLLNRPLCVDPPAAVRDAQPSA